MLLCDYDSWYPTIFELHYLEIKHLLFTYIILYYYITYTHLLDDFSLFSYINVYEWNFISREFVNLPWNFWTFTTRLKKKLITALKFNTDLQYPGCIIFWKKGQTWTLTILGKRKGPTQNMSKCIKLQAELECIQHVLQKHGDSLSFQKAALPVCIVCPQELGSFW